MEFNILKRKIYYKLFSFIPFKKLDPLDISIDIIIPLLSKDLKILPLCLEGVLNCVNHTINNIYLVSPYNEEIISFCDKNKLTYINEESVLGYSPKNLKIVTTNNINRSGWIFQQLLKLSGKIGDSNYFLCIDADHILLQPHTFITKSNKQVFYQSQEYHEPYYTNIKKLLKNENISLSNLSYVAHKMIFNKTDLTTLHSAISELNKQKWDEAIINCLDRKEDAGFSEFELYGNYLKKTNKKLRPWNQKLLSYDKIDTHSNLKHKYGKKYMSITFPEWLNNL